MAKGIEQLMAENSLYGQNIIGNENILNDINSFYMESSKSTLLMARNAVSLSPVGDMISLSNEMSNHCVAKAPYTIIGCVYIHNGEWAIFSTDDDNCEIGIFSENSLTYQRFVNSKDLNFKKSHLIKGIGRVRMYCHRTVYWDDDLNPSRYLDFDDIKWKGVYVNHDGCKEFVFDNDNNFEHQDKSNNNLNDGIYRILDVKKCRLQLTTEKGLDIKAKVSDDNGEIENGTYAFIGAYSLGGESNIITNFFNISNSVVVFNHNNLGGSIQLHVDADDENFEEYTVYVLKFVNQNLDVRLVGSYSTSVKDITLTQFKQDAAKRALASLLTQYDIPEKSAGIYKVGDYLVRIKPTMHQDFNYQPIANRIRTYWVAVEYEKNYYRNHGTNIGYMRDENYAFFIRWVYDTGDKSNLYHIPCNYYKTPVLNSETIKKNTDYGEGKIVDFGEMQQFVSTERYNDKKPEVWGDLCGKQILHHHMPDNTTCPHYQDDKIRVLGVYFDNIQPPKKLVKRELADGSEKWEEVEIDNIIGYEIYRGSRKGNKSIIAKGMINNMRRYVQQVADDEATDKEIYYQNYPYNPQQDEDAFISPYKYKMNTKWRKKGEQIERNVRDIDKEIDGYYGLSKEIFTFHSPDLKAVEAQASNAYLSAKQMSVYGKLKGVMKDTSFFVPEGAPKFKLISMTGMLMSLIIGLGYALFKINGKKKTKLTSANVDYGGTLMMGGVVVGSQGMTGPSAAGSAVQSMTVLAQEAFRKAFDVVADNTKIVASAAGFDSSKTAQDMEHASSTVAGVSSGTQDTLETETENSPLTILPLPVRLAYNIPLFMTFWNNGMNDILEILYSIAKYRHHIAQQVSHGDYNKWEKITRKDYNILNQTWLGNKGVYSMPANKDGSNRFLFMNNLDRPSAIAIHTKETVNLPIKDDSQILWSEYKFGDEKPIESLYVSLKQDLPSQYGQLDNIMPQLASDKLMTLGTNNIVFGGDTFITKYTEKNTMFFFRTDKLFIDMPDGTPINFWDDRMIDNPKFWLNSEKYDLDNVNEAFTSIFKRYSYNTFEPFQFARRFTDQKLQFDEDYQPDNYEIGYVDDNTFVMLENYYKVQYPENFKAYEEMWNKNSDSNDNIEKYKYIGEQFEQLLETALEQRECSCAYYDFKAGRNLHLSSESFRKYLREQQNSSKFIIYNDANSHVVSDAKEDFYNRKMLVSPINCQFLAYADKGTDKTPFGGSFSEQLKIKKTLDIEGITSASSNKKLYSQDMKVKADELKSLCDRIRDIESYQLKYSIFLGFMRFLQFVNTRRKEVEEDKEKDVLYESLACLCWNHHKKKEDPANGHREAAEIFEDPWQDDFTKESDEEESKMHTSHSELGTKYWAGTYNDIPYTFAPDAYNPLLAYFISEESDIRLHFPTREEFIENWNESSQISKTHAGNGIQNTEADQKALTEMEESNYCFGAYKDGDKEKFYFNFDRIFESFTEWRTAEADFTDEDNSENEEDIASYGYMPDEQNGGRKMSYNEAVDVLLGKAKYVPQSGVELLSFNEAKSFINTNKTVIDSSNKAVLSLDNKYIIVKGFMTLTNTKKYVDGDVISTNSEEVFKDNSAFYYMTADGDVDDELVIDKKVTTFNYTNETFSYSDDELQLYSLLDVDMAYETYYTDSIYPVAPTPTQADPEKTASINASCYYILYLPNKGKKEESYENDDVDVNQFYSALYALKDETIDRFFKGSNYYSYWTISGCMKIIAEIKNRFDKKTAKKKFQKNGQFYYLQEGGDGWPDNYKSRYYKFLECKDLTNYFENKGQLKRTREKMEKEISKASKKYDKELKKLQNRYKKTQKKNNFVRRFTEAFQQINPNANYSLDWGHDGTSKAQIYQNFNLFLKNFYMYTYVSGVREFFVESERNVSARDWDNDYNRFYDSLYYNDLRTIFSARIIRQAEDFIMQNSFIPDRARGAFSGDGFARRAIMQSRLYDPYEAAECRTRFNNRIMYSDPSKDTDITDFWRIFRMNDLYDFKDEVTTVLPYGTDIGAVVLFHNSSPVKFTGAATIDPKTATLHMTYGDNALFSRQNMNNVSVNDSYEIYSCQNGYSAINTPIGPFYVSADQGKVFHYGDKFSHLTDFSSGMAAWFRKFMPYMLTKYKEPFEKKEFDLYDNPVIGIGVQTTYDHNKDVIYFAKKDYAIKMDKIKKEGKSIEYRGNGKFKIGGRIYMLGDKEYFDDASFTISLDLKKGMKGWTSFHDWHPDLSMNAHDRIFTTKDNGIYRHNHSSRSYGNFYGVDYPFEVEFQLTTKNAVTTLRSVSYFLETFKYGENEYDRYHTLYDNFDSAIIYNTEQISGKLNLVHQDDKNPDMEVMYPKLSADKNSYDILWSKEEQRYRFNQFWDITSDRMNDVTMFNTEPNGYVRMINPKYVDYMKNDFERKKFRHVVNNIRLSRTANDDNRDINFVFSLNINMNLRSFR